MGVYVHSLFSPYSFVMGMLWFNIFVALGLLMRKLKFPIRFSVIPLLLLLILSVTRMFVAFEPPGAAIILSETIYPAIINFLRLEIISLFGLRINVASALVFIWLSVAACLVARYFYIFISRHGSIIKWLEGCDRDEHAESLLAEMIGSDKKFRIYRSRAFNTPAATAIKPYIILPEVEMAADELRAVLLHEWKHILDRDYLTKRIIDIICFVFWWNPMAYVLRRNFSFVQELKCDNFAVKENRSFKHLLKAIILLENAEFAKAEERMGYEGVSTLVGAKDEIFDRLKVLKIRGESRMRRILANVVYVVVLVALFLASYSITILPATWESPYTPSAVETLTEMLIEDESVFIPSEVFVLDNGNGTFSLYIEGQYVETREEVGAFWELLPIRVRE